MIRIWVDTSRPLCGRVAAADGEPVLPFVGWLQLLAILGRVVEAAGVAREEPLLELTDAPATEHPTGE